jgi:hypothetical protein|tara:strand:+ start:21470 stop:21682 length:213 start_codon:yes stop_codon:yes gene_type:complete
MNQRVAKRLRKICNPVDTVSKRVYRRLKKQYTRVPHHAKRDFLDLLEATFAEIGKVRLDEKQSGVVLDKE